MVWQFLTKLTILLPNNPAAALLGSYSNEVKIYAHTKTCTRMFTADLLITTKFWKQPRFPSTSEWLSKLCYTFTMKYNQWVHLYNEKLIRETNRCPIKPWKSMKETTVYCQVTSQSENLYDSNSIIFWKRQNYRDNKKVSLLLGAWEEKGEMNRLEHRVFLRSETILDDCLMTDNYNMHFSKPIERWTKSMNLI